MSSLMLINPRKRRAHRKTRTAAQKAATRRMVAANKARRHAKSRTVVVHAAANPAPRKRRRHSLKHVAHAVRHSRRRRRNPIGGGIASLLMPAVVGTAGALAVKAAVGYLPLPATMKTGNTAILVKAAAAILLGTFGAKFIGSKARQMAEGSLTVTATEALSGMLAAKGINLAGGDDDTIAYYAPAQTFNIPALTSQMSGYQGSYSGVGEYPNSFGEYQY